MKMLRACNLASFYIKFFYFEARLHILVLLISQFVSIVQSSKNVENSFQLNELVKFESEIIFAVDEYISSLETRLKLTKLYLKDYKESRESSDLKDGKEVKKMGKNGKTVISNSGTRTIKISEIQKSAIVASISSDPLLSFRLLRRFVVDLPMIEKYIRSDNERKFLRIIEKLRKGMEIPKQDDLNTATEGILRVHDAYNLDLEMFTNGQFEGVEGNSTLNAADCYWIGTYSLQANIYTRAIEWLERSFNLAKQEDDKSISFKKVWKQLEKALIQHNTAWHNKSYPKSHYIYEEPVEVRFDDLGVKKRRRILDNSDYQLYQTESSFTDLTNFAKLCRLKQQTTIRPHNLKCWYSNKSPYGLLSPYKIEMLHKKPQVLQVYDILPDSLIDDIKRQAQQSFSRSEVYGKTRESHKKVSASRTSYSSWIKSPKLKDKLFKIYSSLEPLLGLDFKTKDACEDLQVTKYKISGHFNPHLDNILTPELASGLSQEEIRKGDRLATLMFYLTDTMTGGLTAFPRIGVVAKPIKGSALFWFNVQNDGKIDQLSLHGGCPIIYGEKWIANQWIRFNSQMFTRRCEAKHKTVS